MCATPTGPQDPGNHDCGEHLQTSPKYTITGIGGKKGLRPPLLLKRAMMNSEIGFGQKGAAGL